MARHSAETRARISHGVKRANRRKLEAALVRPSHVDQWLRAGIVAPSIRPILEVRASQVESMIEDLGGVDEATNMQKRVLDGWLQSQVCADLLFQKLAQDPKSEVPDKLLSSLNTSRAALVAIGLGRRARDLTPTLAELGYVEVLQPHDQAPEVTPGGANGDGRESGAEVAEEGPQT